MKDRSPEPVEVLPQASADNVLQAVTVIPDEFVVFDGTTYYVSLFADMPC